MAAVSVLNIPVFSNFVNQIVLYIPNLIAGILILVVGVDMIHESEVLTPADEK